MSRIAALVAALAMLALAPLRVSAQSSCDALDYLTRLQAVSAALHATPPNSGAARTQLEAVVSSYPNATRTLAPVVSDLTAVPPDTGDAAARVDAILGALALPPGAVCGADVSAARSSLSQVYHSSVFSNLDRHQTQSLFDQLLSWIASLFNQAGRALGVGGELALGALVLLLVAAVVLWRVRATLASGVARADELPGDTADPDREWRNALQAADRGTYREAIRRAFRAVLLDVARRGRLHVEPAWTTRELLAATRVDASLLAALAPAADSFDRAWYSGAPVDEADWLLARRRCEAVRAAARTRVPA